MGRAIADVDWSADESRLMAGGVQLAGGHKVTRLEALLAWMDENGVKRAWYSVPPPMYRDGIGDEAAARTWCGYVNQALRVIGAPHAARFAPSFLLPVRHAVLAAEIVAACAPHGARFAIAVGHAASGVMLSDPAFDALCRRESIAESLYYAWSKEFLEAGKRRLAGDTARAATTDEVKALRQEARALKEVVAEQALELRLLKKSAIAAGDDLA